MNFDQGNMIKVQETTALERGLSPTAQFVPLLKGKGGDMDLCLGTPDLQDSEPYQLTLGTTKNFHLTSGYSCFPFTC